MAKSIMLDTRTINFLELLGNGKQYTIPAYQRDYSWVEEQWDDLWNDIISLKDDPNSRHYMGALVTQAKSDREFVVIDGQQRLATLTILALVIIARLQKLADNGIDADANRERAASLRSRFVGEKDPASLIERSKLTLNETDDPFFQDYLVQLRKPLNPRGLVRSNRLLWNCFCWFDSKIEDFPEAKADGLKLAELLNETIARQLLFILISVDDELNAYTVFETLNARGLELSSTDLLKNYLFSRVKTPSDLKALQRRWQSMLNTIRQERFPEFLRYHLLCEQPKVRSSRLFKIVRDRIKKPADVFVLMEDLEERAELFSALSDASHEYWNEFPECKQLIRERKLLRGQQSVPLMFAAWEKFGRDDFARVLKLVNVFTFRFTTICGLNTNDLEPLYHHAARAVLDGQATSPSHVFKLLEANYVSDERFRRDLEIFEVSTSGQSKHLAKYILCRLESEASNRDIDFETDTGTIEHILPENPIADWATSIPESDWPKYTYRLGNLTLLESSLNRQTGNKLFPDKVVDYGNSRYGLTAKIAADPPDDWKISQIEERQKKMARRGVHIWRSDFA